MWFRLWLQAMDAAQPKCNAPVRLGVFSVGAAQPSQSQPSAIAQLPNCVLLLQQEGGLRALAFMQDDFVLHGSCIEGEGGV